MNEKDPLFYDRLWKTNSLHRLYEADRLELDSLLSDASVLARSERLDDITQHSDAHHDIAEQCIALADALRKEFFSDPSGRKDWLVRHWPVFPTMLESFGKRVKQRANLTARKGQAHKVLYRSYLIMASEFVRIKTRHYNDDDLADLARLYLPKTTRGKSVTGEWIKDCRAEFRTSYPEYFALLRHNVQQRILEADRENEKILLASIDISTNPVAIKALQDLWLKYARDAESKVSDEVNPVSRTWKNR